MQSKKEEERKRDSFHRQSRERFERELEREREEVPSRGISETCKS
jgi:hypothetical protein